MYVRLLRPPRARFWTSIFVGSNFAAIGVPQPIKPRSEFFAVESPTIHNVGRVLGSAAMDAEERSHVTKRIVKDRICDASYTNRD